MSQNTMTQLRTWITEQGLDAFLVSLPENRSYLSGWLCDESMGGGFLLVDAQQQVLVTNTLYQEIAGREAVGWQITVPEGREYGPIVVDLAKKHGWKKIGFESMAMMYGSYERLQKAGEGAYTLVPFEQNVIDKLRQIKDTHELALLKRAIAITDETFAHICNWIQPGMTEKEVQWEIARYMVSLGADGSSFEAIVASGPNGSMPHAEPGSRRIQRGELITIDMGARYKGYCADMTRTICLGEPAETRMREVYDAVLRSMKVCEAGLHAGIKGQEADALARKQLEATGLAEHFVHSTGHGVGLNVHEGPSLSRFSPDEEVLPTGAVVTVEPGVYIPGWSGVRVEDCVLIQEHGCEVLTQSPTELVIAR